MIPESFIQELLARVDIVDVVERYVPLKKAGANYSACCPFHSEKTPSFTVSPSKQFYHCFGCGAHGSAIGFVMEYAGLGFVEAVEELARHAGMQVPQQRPDERRQKAAEAAPLTEFMARAAKFYREQLKASPKAIDYLRGRGLTGEIAARFGLGYAPDGWQGLAAIFPDYQDKALVECGLVIEGEGGKRYDRFRDRIMFPIEDARGRVIAFGGRAMAADARCACTNRGERGRSTAPGLAGLSNGESQAGYEAGISAVSSPSALRTARASLALLRGFCNHCTWPDSSSSRVFPSG